MQFNLADIFELAVDQFAEREYLVTESTRRTYREIDERANRLAHFLAAKGIGRNDHVGIYAHNCIEWVETLWAVFKLRAIWVNINYRYVEDELAYIVDNADLKALVFQRRFATQVKNVKYAMPSVNHMLMIEDGSEVGLFDLNTVNFEKAMETSAARDFAARSEEDLYMLYTGGTTGMPKGVLWHHKDVFYALGGGIHPTTRTIAKHPQEVLDRGADSSLCVLPAAPLMHGASQWAVMGGAFEGRKIVLMDKFDAEGIWKTIEKENVNALFITGDAMARPLIETYQQNADKYNASSLFIIASSAAVLSQTLKDQFLLHFPNLIILDAMGSSENGTAGLLTVEKGNTQMKGGPTVKPMPGTVVLDPDTLLPLTPDSKKIGVLATSGFIPIGYYKDQKKTAETFVTGPDGTRYVVPGDFAMLEENGDVTVLGRGSVSINSGGEKIFPEEVESAVKSHPDVFDVTVVGVTDEKWGNTVAAVVQARDDKTLSLESIQQHCRKHIAGFKIPRQLHVVDQIVRSPSGKPDYNWAKKVADEAQHKQTNL